MRAASSGKGHRIWRFVTEDVWDIDVGTQPSLKAAGVRFIRVVHMIAKRFREDACPLHASALTLSSLMAIVPIMALSLALARGFGDADTAKAKIRDAVSEWTQTFQVRDASQPVSSVPPPTGGATNNAQQVELAAQIDRMLEVAFARVETINFATLGSIGLILLLWMVTQVLGQVESAFNRVWGVSVGRSLWRRFTDYLSAIIILPLLIIAISSIPVADFATRHLDEGQALFLRTLLSSATLKTAMIGTLTSVAFTLFIKFMPNTTVRLGPAITGGIITGVLFLAWLKICAALQVGVAGYGKIYGGFAAVPIVLAWVYMSWQVVLFGAETSFAVQNCTTYRMEQGAERASVHSRLVLALSVVLDAARAMKGETPGFEAGAFARERRVPVRLLNEVIATLTTAGLMAEVSERTGRYVLLRTPDALLIQEVADTVLETGVAPADLGLANVDSRIQNAMAGLTGGMRGAIKGATVADMLEGRLPPGT